jgi:hypothetical protein
MTPISSRHLAYGLEQRHPDGCGKVQAAHLGSVYGNLDYTFILIIKQGRRQACGFRTKNQTIPWFELEVKEGTSSMCREKNTPTCAQRPSKILQIAVDPQGDRRPVVQPGSLQISVRQTEPKRLNQMKGSLGCRTSSGDVARILRDFRLVEDHLERWSVCHLRWIHSPTVSWLDGLFTVENARLV